jgi:hypothetical protein
VLFRALPNRNLMASPSDPEVYTRAKRWKKSDITPGSH